jgi:hypothetical protein
MTHDSADRKLDALLAAYRDSMPDADPSVNFMPELWQRIDARRSVNRTVRRLAQVFVSAAAALCLVMAILLYVPAGATLTTTYVEALDDDNQSEVIAYADVLHADPGEFE